MNSDVRHSWVMEQLAKIPSGHRILDAGAGSKRYKPFCSHLQYVSQDFCQYDGKGNGEGLHRGSKEALNIDIVGDITNICEQNESFDAIICTEVFEHIANPIEAIKEFNRLLKHNGRLILTAPFCSQTHYAPHHYYSGFNKYFYEKFLSENGFEILSLTANGSFFEFLIQETKRLTKMATKYTDVNLHGSNTPTIANFIELLNRIKVTDKNSSEFLCFGYHILAKKV